MEYTLTKGAVHRPTEKGQQSGWLLVEGYFRERTPNPSVDMSGRVQGIGSLYPAFSLLFLLLCVYLTMISLIANIASQRLFNQKIR